MLSSDYLSKVKEVFKIADEDKDRVLTADELFCYLLSSKTHALNTKHNVDIIGLPITSSYMTASGIHCFLRFKYLSQAGRNARFILNNQKSVDISSWRQSKYPDQQDSTDASFIENVMKNTNVGTLSKNLQLIDDANDLRPGDIITTVKQGYGHAAGVYQILMVQGEKYLKLFAGSYPACSIRIYPFLVSPPQLNTLKSQRLLFFRRWPE